MTMSGDRIIAQRCGGIAPGTNGTVERVDVVGHIHVKWDNGAQSTLTIGVDRWVVHAGSGAGRIGRSHVHSVTTCAHDAEGPTIWWLCGYQPTYTEPDDREDPDDRDD